MLLEKLFVLYERHGAAESELHVGNSVRKNGIIIRMPCVLSIKIRCHFYIACSSSQAKWLGTPTARTFCCVVDPSQILSSSC